LVEVKSAPAAAQAVAQVVAQAGPASGAVAAGAVAVTGVGSVAHAVLPQAAQAAPAAPVVGQVAHGAGPAVAAAAPAAAAPAGVAPSVAATPSALAAAVTAMHQAGQASTTLRLDPPGLGVLSVHVGLGAGGSVNVLFVPALAQTGQMLHANMDGLRQEMAATGLTLGQAQVGGQASGGNTPQQQPAPAAPQPALSTAALEPDDGVRAYA
jgi:flagellar hook-length control protein FliK